MTPIDLSTWNRREHYEFFRQFDEPYFGIAAEVNVTRAYQHCKRHGHSFFLWYHHCCAQAVNAVPELRYRIHENQVVAFEEIHVGTTIMREDHTFSFTFVPFQADFEGFSEAAEQEFARVKSRAGIGLTNNTGRLDIVHYSTLPWIQFSSLDHPRHFSGGDSCPKITFGRFHDVQGERMMPVSIHAHHGLLDGYHIGQFLSQFQDILDAIPME